MLKFIIALFCSSCVASGSLITASAPIPVNGSGYWEWTQYYGQTRSFGFSGTNGTDTIGFGAQGGVDCPNPTLCSSAPPLPDVAGLLDPLGQGPSMSTFINSFQGCNPSAFWTVGCFPQGVTFAADGTGKASLHDLNGNTATADLLGKIVITKQTLTYTNNVVTGERVDFVITATPEPSTFGLGLAAIGLCLLRPRAHLQSR